MAVVLEDIIESVELWLKLIKKPKPYIDPDLDPVLLVPGIAGSMLHAVDEKGNAERVWVRLLGADYEFRKKLWSRFDPKTGVTVSLDPKTKIVVPEDRYGLYAIDILDPDMIIEREAVYYFHEMIVEMKNWGYQEGKTLFGFGYDFRQSNRLQETMERFAAKLELVYTASGGKKNKYHKSLHGGLMVKCFMCLHSDIFEKYVKNWITIATPFRGAPGYITHCLLNGMSFVHGWEQNFFISKWSMQQLLIECPSIYELMACPNFDWKTIPHLEIWRHRANGDGNSNILLESYAPGECISILQEALSNNMVNYDGVEMYLPFNNEILKWANETQKVLSRAKIPSQVKFYNIYGINHETPHSVCYGTQKTPISELQQLPKTKANYVHVDGDGTVPVESAKADGLNAEARVGVPGEHRGIICEHHVFRILKHWLRAGDPDPFYNPLNDYVILPTAFEIEKFRDKGLQVTTLKEDWEIISADEENQENSTDKEPHVSSTALLHVGKDRSSPANARATVTVHPQNEGKQHVEFRAVSVSRNGQECAA